MVLKKPFSARRQPSTDSTQQSPVRETAIDTRAVSIAPVGATAIDDVVADSERDDEPSPGGPVPSSSAAIDASTVAITGVAGVPIADDPAFGFADSSTETATGIGAALGIDVPSVSSIRAAQLDAFQQQTTAGADDSGRSNQGVDRSAIAEVGRTVETRYDDGQVNQRHYVDQQVYLAQHWSSNASGQHYSERGPDTSGFNIREDGHLQEITVLDDALIIEVTDGTREEKLDSGAIITTHPNGDVEFQLDGHREVHHPDGSMTTYEPDGTITYTPPPPAQGTGGGEGEGEAGAPKADEPEEEKKEEEEEEQPPANDTDEGAAGEQEGAGDEEEGSGAGSDDGADDGADETTGDGSETDSSTPTDDYISPEVQAVLDAGRAYGIDPGGTDRHRSSGTGGDVDPTDPAADGNIEVTGEIVDLKRRLLTDPVDPDIVGGTGGGAIGSFAPDAGVIDPTDDADTGPGAMGPEDDPLGGMQPGLEPEAPDAAVGDDGGSGLYEIDPSIRILDDLDIEPVRPGSMLDFDGLGD